MPERIESETANSMSDHYHTRTRPVSADACPKVIKEILFRAAGERV